MVFSLYSCYKCVFLWLLFVSCVLLPVLFWKVSLITSFNPSALTLFLPLISITWPFSSLHVSQLVCFFCCQRVILFFSSTTTILLMIVTVSFKGAGDGSWAFFALLFYPAVTCCLLLLCVSLAQLPPSFTPPFLFQDSQLTELFLKATAPAPFHSKPL